MTLRYTDTIFYYSNYCLCGEEHTFISQVELRVPIRALIMWHFPWLVIQFAHFPEFFNGTQLRFKSRMTLRSDLVLDRHFIYVVWHNPTISKVLGVSDRNEETTRRRLGDTRSEMKWRCAPGSSIDSISMCNLGLFRFRGKSRLPNKKEKENTRLRHKPYMG